MNKNPLEKKEEFFEKIKNHKETIWKVNKDTKKEIRFKFLSQKIDEVRDFLKKNKFIFEETEVFDRRLGFKITFQDDISFSLGSSGKFVGEQGNKGNLFEVEFCKKLKEFIDNPNTKDKEYLEFFKIIEKRFPKQHIVKILHEGTSNKKRKIDFTGDSFQEDIGETISDVSLLLSSGRKVFLSLKFGKNGRFSNSGVSDYFKENEIKKGEIKNKSGVKLLKRLGIDNRSFCEYFNAANEKREFLLKKIQSDKDIKNVDKNFLKNILKTTIGMGYILVIKKDNKIHFEDFYDENSLKSEIASMKNLSFIFPKNKSYTKNISLKLDTKSYILRFQIRHNHGKVYPNVLELSYTIR